MAATAGVKKIPPLDLKIEMKEVHPLLCLLHHYTPFILSFPPIIKVWPYDGCLILSALLIMASHFH